MPKFVTQVIIFSGCKEDIQNKINKWFLDHRMTDGKIIDIQQSSSIDKEFSQRIVISIFYTEVLE